MRKPSLNLVCSILAFGALVSGAAHACSIDTSYQPQAVAQLASGAFEYGGAEDKFFGDVIIDEGGGITSQQISFSPMACDILEFLSVVDCNTTTALAFWGKPEHESGDPYLAEIEYSFAPHTQLERNFEVPLVDLAAKAETQGVEVTHQLQLVVASIPSENRFDIFAGCEIFYPESAGASL